jgi:pantoate--beta-alanine ligase
MEIVSKASSMREAARAARAQQKKLALVPTMGALHEGHLSLVRRAREMADVVVVSIFVNPAQFGPNEDFAKYPRAFHDDVRLLSTLRVECLFAPEAEEMYPLGFRTYVEVEDWGKKLCGATRPGHFRGVATVVTKLFNIMLPHVAVFGRKDAQQAILIERMSRDLNLDVEIVTCPTVREADGLALSSRNRYLSTPQRKAATALYRSLQRAEALIESGETDPNVVQSEMRMVFASEPLARVDYIELVDPGTLEPVERIHNGTLLAVAAFLGSTRLIDNWTVGLP